VPHQFEVRVADQVADVVLGSGEEIIHAQDIVPIGDQAIAQVRAQKPAPRSP